LNPGVFGAMRCRLPVGKQVTVSRRDALGRFRSVERMSCPPDFINHRLPVCNSPESIAPSIVVRAVRMPAAREQHR
jgi:hypothetical protein